MQHGIKEKIEEGLSGYASVRVESVESAYIKRVQCVYGKLDRALVHLGERIYVVGNMEVVEISILCQNYVFRDNTLYFSDKNNINYCFLIQTERANMYIHTHLIKRIDMHRVEIVIRLENRRTSRITKRIQCYIE